MRRGARRHRVAVAVGVRLAQRRRDAERAARPSTSWASATIAAICSRRGGVARRRRRPSPARRMVEWPTRNPALTPSLPSIRSSHSPNVRQSHAGPACSASSGHALDPRHHPHDVVDVARVAERRDREPAVAADDGGDAVQRRRRAHRVPQDLRVVVRVDVDEARARPRARRRRSRARRALRRPSPIATMRPSRMPTSARRRGLPVPSTTSPPRSTTSSTAGKLAVACLGDNGAVRSATGWRTTGGSRVSSTSTSGATPRYGTATCTAASTTPITRFSFYFPPAERYDGRLPPPDRRRRRRQRAHRSAAPGAHRRDRVRARRAAPTLVESNQGHFGLDPLSEPDRHGVAGQRATRHAWRAPGDGDVRIRAASRLRLRRQRRRPRAPSPASSTRPTSGDGAVPYIAGSTNGGVLAGHDVGGRQRPPPARAAVRRRSSTRSSPAAAATRSPASTPSSVTRWPCSTAGLPARRRGPARRPRPGAQHLGAGTRRPCSARPHLLRRLLDRARLHGRRRRARREPDRGEDARAPGRSPGRPRAAVGVARRRRPHDVGGGRRWCRRADGRRGRRASPAVA